MYVLFLSEDKLINSRYRKRSIHSLFKVPHTCSMMHRRAPFDEKRDPNS